VALRRSGVPFEGSCGVAWRPGLAGHSNDLPLNTPGYLAPAERHSDALKKQQNSAQVFAHVVVGVES